MMHLPAIQIGFGTIETKKLPILPNSALVRPTQYNSLEVFENRGQQEIMIGKSKSHGINAQFS